WIQVQASAGGNIGELVNVQIPMGTPLDAPDNEDSVGRLVTDALNANGYTATNLHVLPSPHDNDIDSSGESLFVEISKVGNDEADTIELLVYHSQPDPPGEEPIEEMDIGATTLFGVQFDEIIVEP